MTTKKDRPIGIKVISILYLLGFVFMLIIGIISLFSSYYIISNPLEVESAFTGEELAQIGAVVTLAPFFLIFGIFCLVIAVLDIFLALGFWKAQRWARLTTLILSALGIAYGFVVIISSISDTYNVLINLITVLINGIVIWYLLQKNVIAYFAKKKH